jgi:hypothetical protein
LTNFINYNHLNKPQHKQYREAVSKAFPPIISKSAVIIKNWRTLENYFPEYQHYLILSSGELIGFINTIPFQFNKPLKDLPSRGWDWMFKRGIADYENKRSPNYIGGLQVIIRSKYQGLGYSKMILDHSKSVLKSSEFLNLVIPIRPTKKHLFPNMSMTTYIKKKVESKIYDPWIRAHVNSGAEIIKVCEDSMLITGDLIFWETILNKRIVKSGDYLLKGALSPIKIDFENNIGEYREPNIWIKYSMKTL